MALSMAQGASRDPSVRARAPAQSRGEVDWPALYATVEYTRLPWYSPRPAGWLVEAVAQRWLRPPGPLLDIGCGAGTNALWLARRGFRVRGLDLAPVAVAIARQRASRVGVSATFTQGSIVAAPYEDASFAFAVDSGCFHSLPIADRPRYAREVARVIRPEGLLLVTWIAREETGEYGPPHRLSLEEVVSVLEPFFVVEGTEFAGRSTLRAWSARGHRLSRYTARMRRRRSPQPPPR